MRLPTVKLTPLQSRFVASFAATLFVAGVYYVFLTVRLGGFVYATEVAVPADETNHLPLLLFGESAVEEIENDDFPAIARRQSADTMSINNNNFEESNIRLGETQWWVFPKSEVQGDHAPPTPGLPKFVHENNRIDDEGRGRGELKKRADDLVERATVPVYISLNTCEKPNAKRDADPTPPPLRVYISTSQEKPGPDADGAKQSVYTADAGYMSAKISADGDVYIGVSAPNSSAYDGVYNYRISASIDDYFFQVVDAEPNLFFIDSDIHSALLVTDNTTQSSPDSENYKEWMSINPPYTIFAHNINNTEISGLERSYCALSKHAQVRKGNDAIKASITNRGLGNKPKQQFYVTYLNRSSTYYGILGLDGNGTKSGNGVVGGGGTVWRAMNFTTKSDDNCALLYDLDFCSEVAYAVPSRPNMPLDDLRPLYDNYAKDLYANFNKSLSLIPCNTSSTSMYSLAVTCDDCALSYKQWLCAVTIPRCYDFSSDLPFLQPRNAGQKFANGTSIPPDDPLRKNPVTNASRNPMIDKEIQPGPYKEILPCHDLCSDLVRTCPAALGFACPEGKWMNASYGWRDPSGDITCSYLGAAYYLNGGRSNAPPPHAAMVLVSLVVLVFFVGHLI